MQLMGYTRCMQLMGYTRYDDITSSYSNGRHAREAIVSPSML